MNDGKKSHSFIRSVKNSSSTTGAPRPAAASKRQKSVYANIRLPRRATKGSAGYDFFAPESFTLVPHETILIPTGIRVMIEDGWVLQLFTRARVCRHRLQLDNTVGVIDSDYFEAKTRAIS